jgi:hypothetical protein
MCAGKLPSPADSYLAATAAGAFDPYASPNAGHLYSLASREHRCGRLAPLGGVERPRRAVRFAGLIHRPVRVLGGPVVRAACGGDLKLL